MLKIEEVIAMILRHAKEMSEKQAGMSLTDCIVTIPSNWNLGQREVFHQAISLSGLSLLGFINENTAAALYYGIERNDINETISVLFYNLGN